MDSLHEPAARSATGTRKSLLIAGTLMSCGGLSLAIASENAGPMHIPSASYNVVAISERLHAGGFERVTGVGEMRLGQDAGFRIEYRAEAASLVAACSSAAALVNSCARRFVRNDDRLTVRYEGVIESVAQGTATLKVTSASGNQMPAQPLRALVAPNSAVLAIPIEHTDGTTVVLATRSKFGRHTARIGGDYAFSIRDAQLPDHVVARNGTWKSHQSSVRSGTLTLNHRYLAGQEQGSAMQQLLSCSSGAAGCSAAAALEQELISPQAFAGVTSSDARGGVRLKWMAEGGRSALSSWQGFATPDGEFIALLQSRKAHRMPPRALALAVRPRRDSSVADVAGVFNAIALEEFFDSDGGIRLAYVNGAITLEPNGRWTFLGTDTARKRTECLATDGACPGALMTGRSVQGGAGGGYIVTPAGTVMLEGLAGDNTPRRFVGEISASGSLLLLRRIGDHEACSFDCSGQQSFRSLIVGLRRR